MADPVQLTDLDVIARYSIAVRRASADRAELIQTLRADLAWLQRGQRRTLEPAVEPEDSVEPADDSSVEPDGPPAEAAEPKRAHPPLRRMRATVTPARKPAAKTATKKQTATKKSAAGKTAAKKTATKKTATKKAASKRATNRR